MASYDFHCNDCTEDFNVTMSIKLIDTLVIACVNPECESSNVRRVFSPPGVVFRGPGFYHTDNRKKDK